MMNTKVKMKIHCVLLIFAVITQNAEGSITVEEGRSALLKCPGYTPNQSGDTKSLFGWYKAGLDAISDRNKVAIYAKEDDVQNSLGDLEGRATLDDTTGALEIPQTKVTDDHIYACYFQFVYSGEHKNETRLTITVTPSSNDLKLTYPSHLQEGESVTFKCTAPRVRPQPHKMYWMFADGEKPLAEKRNIETNGDNLTSSVSVVHSFEVHRNDSGKELVCCYVSTTERPIKSRTITLEVLYKSSDNPSGLPLLQSSHQTVRSDTEVTLTCDIDQLDSLITWYVFQREDGRILENTTKQSWKFNITENGETFLRFVCIAGNSLGQSNASEPITIMLESKNTMLILGIAVACVFLFIIIVNGAALWLRRGKSIISTGTVMWRRQAQEIRLSFRPEVRANLDSIPTTTKGGQVNHVYANTGFGDGKYMSEDGLIYIEPAFLTRSSVQDSVHQPNNDGQPRYFNHQPTEYGQLDFQRMADMKMNGL